MLDTYHFIRYKESLWVFQIHSIKGYLCEYIVFCTCSFKHPFPTHFKFNKNMEPNTTKHVLVMKDVIGSLMHVMVCTHPSLAYHVYHISQFMSIHGKEHWMFRCKHVKVDQYVILVFLSESSHKIDLNIKNFEIFSLMINMRFFFYFSIIILWFMFLDQTT